MKLVVVQAFADYQIGNEITDAKEVDEVLATRPGSVVKVASDAPAPAKDAPKADAKGS